MRPRALFRLVAVLALACTPARPQAGSATPASSAAPAPLLWAEGDKNSELQNVSGVPILVLHGQDAEVAVHLTELQGQAIQAWVDILDRGQVEITVDPARPHWRS